METGSGSEDTPVGPSDLDRISVVRSAPRRPQRSLSALFDASNDAIQHPAPPGSPVSTMGSAGGGGGGGVKLSLGGGRRPDWLREEMFRGGVGDEDEDEDDDEDGVPFGGDASTGREGRSAGLTAQPTGSSAGSSIYSSVEGAPEGRGTGAWGRLSLSSLSGLVWRDSSGRHGDEAASARDQDPSVFGSVKSAFSFGSASTSLKSPADTAEQRQGSLWGWWTAPRAEDGSASGHVAKIVEYVSFVSSCLR